MINSKLLQLAINASNDGIVIAEKEGAQDKILEPTSTRHSSASPVTPAKKSFTRIVASCNPETGISQL